MKSEVIEKMQSFLPYLNEEQARLYVASEAKALGRGGKSLIEKGLGFSHNTINRGISELESRSTVVEQGTKQRQRKEGGGRKRSVTDVIWYHIEAFIMPHTRGEPESRQPKNNVLCLPNRSITCFLS